MKTSDSSIITGSANQAEERPDRIHGLAWLLSIFGVFAVCLFFAWLVSKENSPLSSHGERFATAQQYPPEGFGLNRFAQTPTPPAPEQFAVFVYTGQPTLVVLPDVDVTGKIGAQSKSAAQGADASQAAVPQKSIAMAGGTTSLKAQTAAPAPDPKALASESYNDRIEREARGVIHGDYGNNPMRHDMLGADYDAVQARVNQILHS